MFYEENHFICVGEGYPGRGLASFTEHNYFEIYLVVAYINSSFLFIAGVYSITWIYQNCLSNHLDIWGDSTFLLLQTSLKVCVQVFAWTYAFVSLG